MINYGSSLYFQSDKFLTFALLKCVYLCINKKCYNIQTITYFLSEHSNN